MSEPDTTPEAAPADTGTPGAAATAGADATVDGGLRGLRRGVELLAVAWVALMAIVFALRIAYPLELEWMEGGSLHHALRLIRGEPIYAAPSIDFVPFLYTPLYPGLLALLAGIGLPLGLVLGRAVSVAAVAAIAAGLWRLVGAEGKPRAHRAAAVGLFLAGYVFSFRWYDVARADAMMYALLLWGVLLSRSASGGWRRPLVAGLLVALAFWTKQTAAVLIVASGVGGLALGRLRGGRFVALLRYTAAVAVIVLGGLALGDRLTDGWLWTYIYELHQAHAFNHERFARKTWGMLVHAAPALALLAATLVAGDLGGLLTRLRRRGPRLSSLLAAGERAGGERYWGVMAAAALLVSALGYSTQWAEPNAFIPAVIFGAAYLAVALPIGGRRERWALALVASQLLFAAAVEPIYQPIQDRGPAALGDSYRWQEARRTIPDAAARATAAAVRDELVRAPQRLGDGARVLAFQRPWWSVLAGGPGHVGSMGINDVTSEDRARLWQGLVAEIENGPYAELWFEGEPPRQLRGALRGRAFRVLERRVGDARVRPWTGYMSEAGMVTPYRGAQLRVGLVAPRQPPAGAVVVADFEGPGDLSAGSARRRGAAFRPHGAVVGDLPVLGPHGGSSLLGSARSKRELRARGALTTPTFTIPRGGALELLVGVSAGRRGGLELRILSGSDGGGDGDVAERLAALELPALTPWELAPLRWAVPDELAERPLRLELVDDSDVAAIYVDDIWVLPGADAQR